MNLHVVITLHQHYCIYWAFCAGVRFICVGCFVTAHALFWLFGYMCFLLLKLLAVSETLPPAGCFVRVNINEMAADSIIYIETNAFIINGIYY